MAPYAEGVREATGLPVYDLTTLVTWAAAAWVGPIPSRPTPG
jgi:hypothetical protein